MATTDWDKYAKVQKRVGAGKGSKADYKFLQEFDFGDPMSFTGEGFDPYALAGAKEGYLQAEEVRKRYDYDPTDLSAAGYEKTLNAWATASGNVAGAAGSGVFTSAVPERNVVWQDYAMASRNYFNAQSAGNSASTQTQILQGRMRDNAMKDLIRGKGAFFENLKESSEADVRIGSNVQSQRRPKKTSTSVNAATARSKTLIRAPGINI